MAIIEFEGFDKKTTKALKEKVADVVIGGVMDPAQKKLWQRIKRVGGTQMRFIPESGFNQTDDEIEFTLQGIECSATFVRDPVFWINKADGNTIMHSTLKAMVETVTTLASS
jgi:hypothetical protein